jgi:O-antigen ligase
MGHVDRRRLLIGGALVILAAGAIFVIAGDGNRGDGPRRGADTRRLASIESNRYDYWLVAGRMFRSDPLIGGGSGSFATEWRRERTINDTAIDAHSLYFETAAELGGLGLLALALFIGGGAKAALQAARSNRSAAIGPLAALAALAVHAGLDWDWEMPAVSLIGLLLLGSLLASEQRRREEQALSVYEHESFSHDER